VSEVIALPVPESSATWTSRSGKGAASELIASVHLLRQGYHVYRSMAGTAPFDLVAYRDGVLLRVEVKSATMKPGNDRYAPCFTWPANEDWDLLLVADDETGKCVEITSHNPSVGRNQFREHYGFMAL
jgi:hypothetical protein